MIVFLNEDKGYLNWVHRHREGYVLEGHRRPKVGHWVLHRCTCASVRQSVDHRRIHWTTGRKLKACSLTLLELNEWSREETGADPRYCAVCRPEQATSSMANGQKQLTKLGADIIDYVLDAALIHLEHDYSPYALTIGDIAACFHKTFGQLVPIVQRLIDDGYLAVSGQNGHRRLMTPKRIVLPTIRAMRTLEAFRDEDDSAIQIELEKLTAPTDHVNAADRGI